MPQYIYIYIYIYIYCSTPYKKFYIGGIEISRISERIENQGEENIYIYIYIYIYIQILLTLVFNSLSFLLTAFTVIFINSEVSIWMLSFFSFFLYSFSSVLSISIMIISIRITGVSLCKLNNSFKYMFYSSRQCNAKQVFRLCAWIMF